ncbi:hypothetical protein ACH4U7_30395 [Streptomyces sp. NPDC020845]|uniref:hypothetical protein n=1 Tax=Streptomyces sp. NPDC020845 TaxID=3365096 RepID=UPI00379C7D65
MIRIVTSARLRQLCAENLQAQERAREVQGKADQAYSGYIRKLHEVTARAEEAESDAAIIREEAVQLTAAVDDVAAELDAARAELAARADRIAALGKELDAARLEGRSVWLLLHFGEPHSIHRTSEAAKDYTATLGAPRDGWVTDCECCRPAGEVAWRLMTFTTKEGRDAFMAP